METRINIKHIFSQIWIKSVGVFWLVLCVTLFSNNCLAAEVIIYHNLIQGIKDPLLANVKARLRLEQNDDNHQLTPELANNWFRLATTQIKQSLEPFGYFNSTVHSRLVQQQNQWQAIYWVNPGSPTIIETVNIVLTGPGKNNPRLIKLIDSKPIKSGDRMIYKEYQKLKDRLFTVANNNGYLQAKMTENRVLVNRRNNLATIQIVFETGPCFYVGPITFDQNSFQPAFLKRFLPFTTGDLFSANKLLRTQQNMANSNFFQSVDISANTDNPQSHQIPITVKVTPPHSRQYLIGFGYGTDTKARVTLGIQLRHVTDTGQQFKTLIQASQMARMAQAIYTIPGQNPLTDQYAIIAGIENNQPQDYNIINKKLGLNYITKNDDWQKTFGITVQHENDSTGTDAYDFIYPGISFYRLVTDNPLKTSNGYKINFANIAGIIKPNKNFYQTQLNLKWIHTFGEDFRVVMRGDLGYLAMKDADTGPLSLQFFSGGSQSVRGYGYQNLGPGNKLMVGSGEIQQRIYDNWYGGAFFDIGNATNGLLNYEDMNKSTGVSLIFMSTVGPIELSLAKPLNDPLNKKVRFQLSMGPDL